MNQTGSFRRSVAAVSCVVAMAGSVCGAEATTAEDRAVESIRAYCTTSWRNAGIPAAEWEDCTQQTFARLLERIPRGELPTVMREARTRERRELHRCIWCTVQRWRRRPRQPNVVGEASLADPRPLTDRRRWLDLQAVRETLRNNDAGLSETQRQIMEASLRGLSVAEIGGELQMSRHRVSDEKYKAIQKLRSRFDRCI